MSDSAPIIPVSIAVALIVIAFVYCGQLYSHRRTYKSFRQLLRKKYLVQYGMANIVANPNQILQAQRIDHLIAGEWWIEFTYALGNFVTQKFEIQRRIKKDGPGYFGIEIKTKDSIKGCWRGRGFLGWTQWGLKLWFLKEYSRSLVDPLEDPWHFIVFDGQYDEMSGKFYGRWFR